MIYIDFNKYPGLEEHFEMLCRTRRNEILQNMVEGDSHYNELCSVRSEASMLLREILGDKYDFLEKYSNAVYAQECYELDMIYRQGIIDILEALAEWELL